MAYRRKKLFLLHSISRIIKLLDIDFEGYIKAITRIVLVIRSVNMVNELQMNKL